MVQNFAVGIPTLNRVDLLMPSLMLYLKDMPNVHIYVLDNGNQDFWNLLSPKITIIKNESNIGVASSWNVLCQKIYERGYENALILNDDIYLGRKEYQISMLLSQYTKKDFYIGMMDWSAFIMPKKTYIKVGQFDEDFFPAYYEDNDYEYRMRLGMCKVMRTPVLNPIIYRNSSTMEKFPEVQEMAHQNKARYVRKWGGLPDDETFKTPYNNHNL